MLPKIYKRESMGVMNMMKLSLPQIGVKEKDEI